MLKPLPSLILNKVKNVSPQESAELMSFLRPPNPDQGYGHQRYNDQDHRRQQYWDREPSRRQGGREGERPFAPLNSDQGYGSQRYNDRQGGREREPNRGANDYYGPNRGANNYYGPSGGNSGSGERANHPQDLITPNRDFPQNLLAFGPRNDVNPPRRAKPSRWT